MTATKNLFKVAAVAFAVFALGFAAYVQWWFRSPPLVRFGGRFAKQMDVSKLQAWAAEELGATSTNRCIEFPDLPLFIRQVPAPMLPWRGLVEPDDGVVHLISMGSFGSYGVSVGSASRTEATNSLCYQIAPGVYAHRYP